VVHREHHRIECDTVQQVCISGQDTKTNTPSMADLDQKQGWEYELIFDPMPTDLEKNTLTTDNTLEVLKKFETLCNTRLSNNGYTKELEPVFQQPGGSVDIDQQHSRISVHKVDDDGIAVRVQWSMNAINGERRLYTKEACEPTMAELELFTRVQDASIEFIQLELRKEFPDLIFVAPKQYIHFPC
jgi:hypothetical protein